MIKKQHRMKLKSPASFSLVTKLNEQLIEIDQNAQVEIDKNPHYLMVSYDLNRLSLDQILEKMEFQGVQINRSLLWRLIYAKWNFTEENERDNLSVRPSPCCSNPEGILKKSKKLKIV